MSVAKILRLACRCQRAGGWQGVVRAIWMLENSHNPMEADRQMCDPYRLDHCRITAPLTRSPGEYWRCGSSGSIWKSTKLRACFLRGEVNLENSERVDEAEGFCKSEGVAFAHMLGWKCGDMFECQELNRWCQGLCHVDSRALWTCAAQTLGCGTGTGRLGGALYYNHPTRSLFNVGVCMHSRGWRVWLGLVQVRVK